MLDREKKLVGEPWGFYAVVFPRYSNEKGSPKMDKIRFS